MMCMIFRMGFRPVVLPVLAGLMAVLCVPASGDFIHPGVMHSVERIEFTKEKIEAGEEPWAGEWKKLRSSRYADVGWTPQARAHVERGPSNQPNIGSSDFTSDSRAAHTHALAWVMTGNEVHVKKAAEILDAWSGTLETITNHDARLLIGMNGQSFVVAAELVKHTWDGWPEEKQERFGKMLRTVWYPVIKDFYPTANGNWDASMIQVMMAMGIFLDDQAMFDRAVNYFRSGEGNGNVRHYFSETGECQESGRDQAHTQMGLEYLANSAETAWVQGIDLYGEADNRLLKGFEYTAKYNLGFEVPYEPFRSVEGRYHYKRISDNSRGRLREMYEKVYNHYVNRRGLEAPYTGKAAMKVRENRRDRRVRRSGASMMWDALMFSGEPEGSVKQASR